MEKRTGDFMNYILGLNSVYHESSVCLVADGELIAYAEEERLNRVKHAKYSTPQNTDVLPLKSIDTCLQTAGITGKQITTVGFSFMPGKRLQNLHADPYPIGGDGYGTAVGENLLQAKLQLLPAQIRDYLNQPTVEFVWLDHHLCHAAGAFLISPFQEAAVLVIDGIGEYETVSLGYGQNHETSIGETIKYPHSLGFLWEKIATLLGYTKYDAGKIMGLGGYGQSDETYRKFRQFVDFGGGKFCIDNHVLKIRTDDYGELERVFGCKRRSPSEPINEHHANLVAGLQQITEEIILHLADHLAQTTQSENLCLAGGVALNCQANTRLAQEGKFKNIYIPPHCNDAGTSIGAALHLSYQAGAQRKPATKPFFPYWRSAVSESEVQASLQQSPYPYHKAENINQSVAELLAAGEIVA
jgi:carbamoyltransferase